MLEPRTRDAQQAVTAGEKVLDHARQRKRRVFEAEPDQLRVLVQQGDDFARLRGQSALAGGEQIEVRQYDNPPLDGAAHGITQLPNHHPYQTAIWIGWLVAAGPTVQIEATQLGLPQPRSDVHEDVRRQILIALHERGQTTLQVRRHLREIRRVSCLDGLVGC